jgi:hypothetical protein
MVLVASCAALIFEFASGCVANAFIARQILKVDVQIEI